MLDKSTEECRHQDGLCFLKREKANRLWGGGELPAFRVDFHSKAGFSAETFSLLSNDLLSFSGMGEKYWCHSPHSHSVISERADSQQNITG